MSQQTKKIKNLENTLDEIVRRKDEHRDLMNEFLTGEISWSQKLEEKYQEEKRQEIERMEKEIEELRSQLEVERVKEEEKYSSLMLDYMEQEGAARMLNQKIQRMRERKEQRRLSNMSLILGLLEELDAQKARVEKEKAEALERLRNSATQTDVTMSNTYKTGSTQTDAVQYLHSTTQTFLLVKGTADEATQTRRPQTQCSHTQTHTLTRSSSDGETQTCLSPNARNSLRRSNLRMGTGGTYFKHLQETVVFPSTAKAASKLNRDCDSKNLDFCSKYIITSEDMPLEYCPAVSDTPRTITPIEVKVTENNNYMKHNVSFHDDIEAIHVIPEQAPLRQSTPPPLRSPVKTRRPFYRSGEVRSSRIPTSRPVCVTDTVTTSRVERPSRLPVVPMETRAPMDVAGSRHLPMRITDTCRNNGSYLLKYRLSILVNIALKFL